MRQSKKHYLYNDKNNNLTSGYNPSKHLCTQHRSTDICKAKLKKLKKQQQSPK